MEILNEPMVELVSELRPIIEKGLESLITKMAITNIIVGSRGGQVAVDMPAGYKPASFSISTAWPPVFPVTMEDLQKKVGVAANASNSNIISRETATKWVAKDFGVEDIEEEVKKVNEQPNLNPFGGF